MRAEQLAYIAGFFDGEGTVSIAPNKTRKKVNYVLTVYIYQQDKAPLELIQKEFGGHFWKGRDRCWHLQLGNAKAAHFLVSIYPFLIVKREEARIALEFRSTVDSTRRTPLTDEERGKRERLYLQLKATRSTDEAAIQA